MIHHLRRLLILLLIVVLPWPGAAMMADGSAVIKATQAAKSHPCHDSGDDSATASQPVTDSSPLPKSCAAGHAGKCCVACQVHSLPVVLPHFTPQSGFTPYRPPAACWSGFIPDLLHRPPR